jgi:hypothetical protein
LLNVPAVDILATMQMKRASYYAYSYATHTGRGDRHMRA